MQEPPAPTPLPPRYFYRQRLGKRIAIVGGGAILQPDSDPLPGARIDIDGGTAPTLSASWYINDNIAVELWGAADKFNHRVRGDGGKIGTIEQQPHRVERPVPFPQRR